MKKQAQYTQLKYTKGQKNRKIREKKEKKKRKEKENKKRRIFSKLFEKKQYLVLDLLKLKGVGENRDLFSSQCHLYYSNCEISPRIKLVFLLKIGEYRF